MTTVKTTTKKRAPLSVAASSKASTAPAGTVAKAGASVKPVPSVAAKPKLIRDSFTIPKAEYAVLDALKLRAARLMRPTKKSEVLRAGIFALNAMDDRVFLATLNSVPSLKTGRPKAPPAAGSADQPTPA